MTLVCRFLDMSPQTRFILGRSVISMVALVYGISFK